MYDRNRHAAEERALRSVEFQKGFLYASIFGSVHMYITGACAARRLWCSANRFANDRKPKRLLIPGCVSHRAVAHRSRRVGDTCNRSDRWGKLAGSDNHRNIRFNTCYIF
jgi:hypothetical protein